MCTLYIYIFILNIGYIFCKITIDAIITPLIYVYIYEYPVKDKVNYFWLSVKVQITVNLSPQSFIVNIRVHLPGIQNYSYS